MSDPLVLYRQDGPVATISFNRPDVMNASSYAMRADLSDAMDRAESDPAIRCVILTGEGRGFGAGADLTEGFTEHRGTINEHILKDHARLIDNIVQSDKAYIGALNGAVAGVSISYALCCDMIVMAEDAFLYAPFCGINLIPDGGATWNLHRAFGYQKAFEIITGLRRVTAAECLDAGLANAVVPADKLREAAMEKALLIASRSAPAALKYAKKLLRRADMASREEVVRAEADFQHVVSLMDDHREGVAAFLEKRKPQFTGR